MDAVDGPPAATLAVQSVSRGRWFDETDVVFASPSLPPAFDGFTIIQITDTHLGARTRFAEPLIEYVSRQAPDLWVLTGDVIESPKGIPTALELVSSARASADVIMVPGNNDTRVFECHPELAAEFAGATSAMLVNESTPIERHGDALWVVGVDDPSRCREDVPAALVGVPAGAFRMMLAHSIDALPAATEAGIDVAICGHSHGGQIRLPFCGALSPGNERVKGRRFAEGAHRFGETWAYVCRGLGASVLPFRLFCRREVTRFVLRQGGKPVDAGA
jgi:predicted MPP superfamily phosphohydrolase